MVDLSISTAQTWRAYSGSLQGPDLSHLQHWWQRPKVAHMLCCRQHHTTLPPISSPSCASRQIYSKITLTASQADVFFQTRKLFSLSVWCTRGGLPWRSGPANRPLISLHTPFARHLCSLDGCNQGWHTTLQCDSCVCLSGEQ